MSSEQVDRDRVENATFSRGDVLGRGVGQKLSQDLQDLLVLDDDLHINGSPSLDSFENARKSWSDLQIGHGTFEQLTSHGR